MASFLLMRTALDTHRPGQHLGDEEDARPESIVKRIDEAHNSEAGGVIAPGWRHRAAPISGSATEEGATEGLPREAMAGYEAETRWAPLAGHTEGSTSPMKEDVETKVTVPFSAAPVRRCCRPVVPAES